MNILAIDTSTKRLCLGLVNHRGKIIEYDIDSEIRHTELLLPTIKRALGRLSLSLRDVDYFAVGLGPGSFTGLRIGLATIKGFTLASGAPVIGLPSLDIIATNALPRDGGIVCPLIDAKRNLLFTVLYEVGLNNRLKRRSPYLLINIEELLKRIYKSHSVDRLLSGQKYRHNLVTFLGDGLRLYQHRLKQKVKNSIFLNEDTWYPRAKNLIKLAIGLIDKGKLSDARRIRPIYLYPKECQIKIKYQK